MLFTDIILQFPYRLFFLKCELIKNLYIEAEILKFLVFSFRSFIIIINK